MRAHGTIFANVVGLLIVMSATSATLMAWALTRRPSLIIELYHALSSVLQYL